MSFLDLLFGKPLASSDERAEKIGPSAGIPIFGLDALSSAAYGPEAALTLLIPLGLAGVAYIVPISTAIIILLVIVYFSYRQTIEAYPGGGGSYTVARENLGDFAGLLAASALMIDYVLVVAVGISAGVGALVSAVPSLQPHLLSLSLVILVLITIVNLRGVREAGGAFMVPTYLFLGTMLIAIVIGLAKTVLSGGHPMPVVAPPPAPQATVAAAGAWLLLKVFASGCTALTGVEAVSNGVKAFREPTTKNAQTTLTIIIGLLIILLAGVAYLVKVYGIAATDPGAPGYQNVLSMLLTAVAGRGIFYYVSIGSILLVLALSANTAFADFPRLCRIIAQDDYLPRSFSTRGRRLVYSQGIYVLASLSAILLIIFGGVTDRLIPLFAVGAFLAFTLSQAGMVFHWRRVGGPHATRFMMVNGLGALVTGVTVLVVLVAKFVEGAWITLLLIPLILSVMGAIHRQYRKVGQLVATKDALDIKHLRQPIVVVPIDRWSKIGQRALSFAMVLSQEITVLHIAGEAEDDHDVLSEQWCHFVENPALQLGVQPPKLVVVRSPYRYVISPIIDYVTELERKNPHRDIAVLIPELVERKWYYYLLHNQRAAWLKGLLYVKGSHHTIVINIPWYIEGGKLPEADSSVSAVQT